MGLLEKLKEQALNSVNDLNGFLQEKANTVQKQQGVDSNQPTQSFNTQPAQPIPQPKSSGSGEGLYGNYMEQLIEMALADGELTEKEKQVLFKKAEAAGIDLDEFEMVLDARLYEKQKAMESEQPVSAGGAAPKSDKYGDVKKCPSCGAIVESFSTKCPDCGYEFRNIEAISSVTAFFHKMEQIEANSSGGFFSAFGVDKATKQKQNLIASFPIPTSKEDILEFLSMAVPQAKDMGFLQKMKGNVTQEQAMLKPVWKRKCEQIILKARFSMKDDPATLAEIENYAKELKIK